MQYIGKLDKNKLGKYASKDYQEFGKYIKNIIKNPDYIIEDNRHSDTIILLKEIQKIMKKTRIVIKLALGKDEEHDKNSIITIMRQNDRTWKQTIKNRGRIIWKNKKVDKKE